MSKKNLSINICCLLSALLMTMVANATVVQFETNLGDFDVELFDEEMPITVANFLTYVDAGDYDNTVFHRLIKGFILQGGGYTFEDTGPFRKIIARDTIAHEHELANLTGTLSMARVGSDLDSAVSQWFFNLRDNTEYDKDGESYAAFGRVVGDGIDVINEIGDLPVRRYRRYVDTPQNNLPVLIESSGSVIEDHLVYIYSISRKSETSSSSSEASASSESSVSSSISSSSVESSSSISSSSSVISSSSSVSSSSASSISSSSVSVSSSSSSVSSRAAAPAAASSGGGGSLHFIALLFLLLIGARKYNRQ